MRVYSKFNLTNTCVKRKLYHFWNPEAVYFRIRYSTYDLEYVKVMSGLEHTVDGL